MRRDPLLAALVEEVNQAAVCLQAARRVIAEITRFPADADRTTPSLRYTGMTVAEAAAALGIGEEQVRRLLRRGDLVGVAYGGRVGWRLSREYVARVVAGGGPTKAGKDAARRGARPVGRPPKTHVGKLKRRRSPSAQQRD